MTAIVRLVGTIAGESNSLPLTVGVKVLVNEITAIVRVQPQKGKWQALAHSVHCTAYTLLTFSPHSNTLRPTAEYIHYRQGGQVEALAALTTVRHQVNFQEARVILLPVSKGTDGDGVLSKLPGLVMVKGRRPPRQCHGRNRRSMIGGGAHPAKLSLNLNGYGSFAMPP